MPSLEELPSYARLPLDVAAAEGDDLVLADGRRLLDLYGGHCVNLLGAGDRELGEAIARQWRTLSFATNLLPLPGRERFLAALRPGLPDGEWRAFLSNSGAEANENALKAALSATGRDVVVCFSGAFHGRTAGAAALNDGKESGFVRPPFRVRRIAWGDVTEAERAIDEQVACVLLEPIQSLAGVVDPPDGFLEALRAACDAAGALLLFDEVQCGNGRLGTPWAAQHFGVVPDGFTTAKGLGGGFPVGLTVLSRAVADRLDPKLFGSTFGGGPVALAAATHVAGRVLAPGFLEAVRERSQAFRALACTGPVTRVRGAGLLLGLELAEGWTARDVRDRLLAAGIFVGTCDDPRVVRLTPPLTVSAEAPARLARALADLPSGAVPASSSPAEVHP